MAIEAKNYSIANDTLNGRVNHDVLKAEIEADAGITTALNVPPWFRSVGDVMSIVFVAPPTAPEVTALDAVVAAHAGPITSQKFQFWEISGGAPAASTVSQAWQNVMSRTSAPTAAGVYILTYSFELRVVAAGALNSGAMGRFRVDGSTKANACHATEDWCAFAGWDRKVFQEGEEAVLDIEFRRNPAIGGNDTIEIRKLKMGIERKKV